jgi:hypothetical protein
VEVATAACEEVRRWARDYSLPTAPARTSRYRPDVRNPGRQILVSAPGAEPLGIWHGGAWCLGIPPGGDCRETNRTASVNCFVIERLDGNMPPLEIATPAAFVLPGGYRVSWSRGTAGVPPASHPGSYYVMSFSPIVLSNFLFLDPAATSHPATFVPCQKQ